jgi:hypothetical protein
MLLGCERCISDNGTAGLLQAMLMQPPFTGLTVLSILSCFVGVVVVVDCVAAVVFQGAAYQAATPPCSLLSW